MRKKIILAAFALLVLAPASASAAVKFCVPNAAKATVITTNNGGESSCSTGYTAAWGLSAEEHEHIVYVAKGPGEIPTIEIKGADLRLKAAAPYELTSGNLIIDPEPAGLSAHESADIGGKNELTGTHGGMVVLGRSNVASATDATVTGGGSNKASAEEATVSGGFGNTASKRYAVVGGGKDNTASGEYSGVFGGSLKEASAENEALL